MTKLNQALDRVVWRRLYPAKPPQPSPELQSMLAEYYADDVRELERTIGRQLPWLVGK